MCNALHLSVQWCKSSVHACHVHLRHSRESPCLCKSINRWFWTPCHISITANAPSEHSSHKQATDLSPRLSPSIFVPIPFFLEASVPLLLILTYPLEYSIDIGLSGYGLPHAMLYHPSYVFLKQLEKELLWAESIRSLPQISYVETVSSM